MLRGQSLFALLERHEFLRKSIAGLREDMPQSFQELKDFYLEKEVYSLLELMVNKPSEMDEKYMIWVKDGKLPHIFERKDMYSEVEARIIGRRTKIPPDDFDEMMNNCR